MKTDNNENSKKLYSLAPTDNAENFEIYEEYLESSLTNDDNKNIAISGGYASGKSSIIKTYFKNNKECVRYVSFGNYISRDKFYENMDDIEISILQQLLYCNNPEKLPLSRIDRIDKSNSRINRDSFIGGVIISFLLSIMFVFANSEVFNELSDHLIVLILTIIGLIGGIFIVSCFLLYKLFSKFGVKKISFKDNDIEFFNNEDLPILNRYIDELLHYILVNTQIKFIVFEDIDRLKKSIEVFSGLKEINSIINNRIKCNDNERVVKFIYLIKDNIFESAENRTKFFDIIIPIIPFAGTIRIKNIFNTLMKKEVSFDLSEIEYLVVYINNIREIYDIINEFKLFRDMYMKNKKEDISDEEYEMIIALCIYKVMYPKRFVMLVDNKGPVSYYFTEDCKTAYNNQDIEVDYMDDDIFNYVNKSLPESYKYEDNSIDKVDEKELYTLNDFEIDMITSNLIDSSYQRYIVVKDVNDLTDNDERVYNDIIHKHNSSFDRKIDEPSKLLKELSPSFFIDDSVCINSLFDELMFSNNKSSCLDEFYNNITSKKIEFISSYDNNEIIKNTKECIDSILKFMSDKTKLIKLDYRNRILAKLFYMNTDIDNDYYNKTMSEEQKIFEYLEKYYDEKSTTVVFGSDIVFKQDSISPQNKNVINLIYNQDLYVYNFKLLESISNSGVIKDGFSFDSSRIIESFIKLHEDNLVRKFYSNDIDSFISNIINFGKQKDSEDSLKSFINEYGLSDDLVTRILSNEDIKISDLSWIEPNLYEYIYNSNKFIKNMKNLFILKKHLAGNFSLTEIINDNCDEVLRNTNNIDEFFEDIYNHVLSDTTLDLESYEKVVGSLIKDKIILKGIPFNISITNNSSKYLNALMKFDGYSLSGDEINAFLNINYDGATSNINHFIDCIKDEITDYNYSSFSSNAIKYILEKNIFSTNITIRIINSNRNKLDSISNTLLDYLLKNECEILDLICYILQKSNYDSEKRIRLAIKYKERIENVFEHLKGSIYLDKEFRITNIKISNDEISQLYDIGIKCTRGKNSIIIRRL